MKISDYQNASRIERLNSLRETVQELINEGEDMADILASINNKIKELS